MTELGCTPSQTVGPFLSIVLPWPDGPDLVADGTDEAIVIRGRLIDGAGAPVPDGLIEVWQADPAGRFDHPDDPRGASPFPGFRGFGRCPTDAEGSFWFRTRKPGALPAGDGRTEAPHLDVTVLARGLLQRLVTRMYFPDEAAANAADPVLSELDAEDRARMIAAARDDGTLGFDIRLRGAGETPFFAL
jgi:protocatechuate 3,4-dioxygenase alpha subunit